MPDRAHKDNEKGGDKGSQVKVRAKARGGRKGPKGQGRKADDIPTRLTPDSRERLIVDEAIQYFAEVGLSGQTRQLAERLGITQPLVYRYFPTKRALIDRVFQEVFVKRIDDQWLTDLADTSTALDERLREFYKRYATLVCRYEWIRIYMFASLLDQRKGCEYVQEAEDDVLRRVCEAVRIHFGLPSVNVIPISDLELEQFWLLHSGLYYYAIRKFVYRSRIHTDLEGVLARNVEIMVSGLQGLVNRDKSKRQGATPYR